MKKDKDLKEILEQIEEFFDQFDQNIIFFEIQEGAKVERFVRVKDYLYLSSKVRAIIKGENNNAKKDSRKWIKKRFYEVK